MVSITFQLKDKKAEKTAIILVLSYGAFEFDKNGNKKYVQFKYRIGESINPLSWNQKENRAKKTYKVGNENKTFFEYLELNNRLADMDERSQKVVAKMKQQNIPVNNLTLKVAFDNEFKNETQGGFFVDFINGYISETTDKAANTVEFYNSTKKHLIDYQNKENIKLTFEMITPAFRDKFVNFLKGKNLAPSTINTNISFIKTFMNQAFNKNLHTNMEYKKSTFKKVDMDERNYVYLTPSEIVKLYNLDLASNRKLEKIRDFFVIACNMGLRFSDWNKIKRENIVNGSLTIKTQKTKSTVKIPLNTQVKNILERNKYNMGDIDVEQTVNSAIKKICEMAGINETLSNDKTVGHDKISQNVQKCKLVSTHTARRSFATNCFEAKLPVDVIMSMTGHKDRDTFFQ